MGRVGSNERQREFAKEYEKLCYRFNRHEVWQDFVWLAASAISNAVDKRHAEQREAQYMQIIGKYTHEEAQVFPHLFALIVAGMEEYPDQDFLGELYMQLELGNAKNGQFFTPYSVCRCMAEISIDAGLMEARLKKHGYGSINDPACGAGATRVAAAMVLKERGVNYQQQAIFIGQDIDYTVGLMCYIQLSLLGCAGYVRIGDTICDPMTGHVLFGEGKDTTWYTPMFFSDLWSTRRAIAKAKAIFKQFEPATEAIPSEEPAEEPGNGPESAPEDPREEIPEEPHKAALEAPQEPEEPTEPVFVISNKKKNAGQLMFDFG